MKGKKCREINQNFVKLTKYFSREILKLWGKLYFLDKKSFKYVL